MASAQAEGSWTVHLNMVQMANFMLWPFYHNGGGARGCRISVLHGCEMAVSLKLSQVRVKSNFSSVLNAYFMVSIIMFPRKRI